MLEQSTVEQRETLISLVKNNALDVLQISEKWPSAVRPTLNQIRDAIVQLASVARIQCYGTTWASR